MDNTQADITADLTDKQLGHCYTSAFNSAYDKPGACIHDGQCAGYRAVAALAREGWRPKLLQQLPELAEQLRELAEILTRMGFVTLAPPAWPSRLQRAAGASAGTCVPAVAEPPGLGNRLPHLPQAPSIKPRYVIVFKTVNTADKEAPPKYEKQGQGTARFHCFSQDHEEYDGDPGPIPVAIIEWPDGQVETVYANNIKFVPEEQVLRDKQIEAHKVFDNNPCKEKLQNIVNATEFADWTLSRAHHALRQPDPVSIPEELLKIGELLRTQDNHCTAYPIFLVRGLRRIYGMDPDQGYHDFEWISVADDFMVVEAPEDEDNPPEGVDKVYYTEEWETLKMAFTRAGCEEHLRINGHNYRNTYRKVTIYADSLWRMPEMITIRKFLLSLPPPTPEAV